MDPNTMTLLLLPLMAVAFYFLLIRPQRKRAQAQQKLLEQMQPGERVVTHSGIFGTLVSTGAKQSVLQIAPGVEITVLKQAVARVVQATDEDGVEDELETDSLDAEVETAAAGAGTTGAAGSTDPTDPTASTQQTDREFDPYRPGEPSSLDLPEQPAVDAPSSPVAGAPDERAQRTDDDAGIRDVTSTYFQRSDSAASTESTRPTTRPNTDS